MVLSSLKSKICCNVTCSYVEGSFLKDLQFTIRGTPTQKASEATLTLKVRRFCLTFNAQLSSRLAQLASPLTVNCGKHQRTTKEGKGARSSGMARGRRRSTEEDWRRVEERSGKGGGSNSYGITGRKKAPQGVLRRLPVIP